jgi:hypothetical protein
MAVAGVLEEGEMVLGFWLLAQRSTDHDLTAGKIS